MSEVEEESLRVLTRDFTLEEKTVFYAWYFWFTASTQSEFGKSEAEEIIRATSGYPRVKAIIEKIAIKRLAQIFPFPAGAKK